MNTRNKISSSILFVLILVLIALLIQSHTSAANNQVREIYRADFQYSDFDSFERSWQDAALIAVNVIGETQDVLTLEIEYMYAGTRGEYATTCGRIHQDGKALLLGCRPNGIQKGHHKVKVQYSSYSETPDSMCSDQVIFHIYDKKGHGIFNQAFTYHKTWLRSDVNWLSKIKQLFYFC
ncbi:hypothetical protein HR060_10920 [Catenovulum sp. SM1970]|uniref:hypothetical protein n=1 Tax=Marinifaba aquimaris TaxID=2741323 RepID=UPI00157170A7|nr:hypothetical protein [Marinifaba aquimaris]NTS77372.1 hypothetical protein [Marinifaba aquimaris]